ncbi:MAG TPA: 50S ribosomal protein L4 [Armatimonadetes bacterium]|nr:50S ribosomal protein L4 [Armatimonadota bacterium]
MAEVPVVDIKGQEVGRLSVSDLIFGAEVRPDLMHQVVVAQLAARRAGTASTKTRGEVRGGGAKPWRQKGTGRARHGSRRSPLWVGGGVVFGPKPRDYSKKVPRKVRRKALFSAFSAKVKEGAWLVVDELTLPALKTKYAAEVIAALTDARRILLLLATEERELARAFRNLPQVNIYTAPYVSVYDLLLHEVVIATRAAMRRIEEEWVSR